MGNPMQHIREPSKKTPVMAETDVLVVGSGPGGLSAALACAREGVKTMLVERYGCFGGVITQVGVESLAWYRHQDTIDSEGIGIEFEKRAKAMGGTQKEPQSLSQTLNAELFKSVADTLVTEAGIIPLLHCPAAHVLMEGRTIKGIITESKSGRQAILARRVIDATGDADIAWRAGVPVRKTPREEMMGVTVVFSCTGVNKDKFLDYIAEQKPTYEDWGKNWTIETSGKEENLFSPYLSEPFQKARKDGAIPAELTGIGGTWSTISDTGEATYLNMTYMLDCDGTDVRNLTRAEIDGRKQALLAIKALKQYVPGFKKARLRNFGMSVGVRDTRKIIGEYNLSETDVRHQGRFEDAIGIFPEFIDGYGKLILPTTGRYFQVPFGILVPQKIENLLVAGRCVAGDKISHAAARNMMCCTVTGQGAGVAAAISIKESVACRNVNITMLQKALKKQGVRIA